VKDPRGRSIFRKRGGQCHEQGGIDPKKGESPTEMVNVHETSGGGGRGAPQTSGGKEVCKEKILSRGEGVGGRTGRNGRPPRGKCVSKNPLPEKSHQKNSSISEFPTFSGGRGHQQAGLRTEGPEGGKKVAGGASLSPKGGRFLIRREG